MLAISLLVMTLSLADVIKLNSEESACVQNSCAVVTDTAPENANMPQMFTYVTEDIQVGETPGLGGFLFFAWCLQHVGDVKQGKGMLVQFNTHRANGSNDNIIGCNTTLHKVSLDNSNQATVTLRIVGNPDPVQLFRVNYDPTSAEFSVTQFIVPGVTTSEIEVPLEMTNFPVPFGFQHLLPASQTREF